MQCRLSVNDDGLGLKDSVSDCLPTCEEVCSNLLESHNRCTTSLNNSIAYINNFCQTQDHGVTLNIASLRAQRSVSNNSTGLQHYLTAMIENSTRKTLIETLDSKHLGWFSSVSNEMASRWLSVLPKCPSFTFDSSSFRILLCNRLYLPQPERL